MTWIYNKTVNTHTVFINNNENSKVRASSAVLLRSPFFWDNRWRRLVIGYRNFGTAYLSIFNGQQIFSDSNFEDGTGRLYRHVGNKLPNYAALHPTRAETCILITVTIDMLAVLRSHVQYADGVYQPSRTAYRLHLQWSSSLKKTFEGGTHRLSRNVGKQQTTYTA